MKKTLRFTASIEVEENDLDNAKKFMFEGEGMFTGNGWNVEWTEETEEEKMRRLSDKWLFWRPKPEDVKTIKVKVYPNYWEDTFVNGEHDNADNPDMPFSNGDRWEIQIDRATGNIIGWPSGVTAKTHYKSVDENEVILIGQDGETIVNYDGYVPNFLSIYDNGYGDYVMVEIEPDGHIKDFNFTSDDIDELY